MRRINKILGLMLSFMAAAVFSLSNTACQPEGIVDNTEFSLHYSGITDVGPSTPMSLTPTYIGQKPSNFVITAVTVDGEPLQTDCFSINEDTGVFNMRNTDNLPVGLYRISISCVSAGKTWNFPDIITINMMKVIPDGIKMEPSELVLPLTDITDPAPETVLPTAQIITEGNHISIKEYKIAGARRNGVKVEGVDKLFTVSPEGKVMIKGNNRDFLPGIYMIDFKLVTFVVDADSEEGIFSDALTVNVTSEPKSLVYTPSEGKIEQGIGWTFDAPAVAGSVEGLKFSFGDLKKMNEAGESFDFTDAEKGDISIDEATGAVTIRDGHGFAIGEVLTIAVNVANKYGSYSAPRALVLTVVRAIKPIVNFTYPDVNIVQIQKFTQNVAAEFEGDDVKFSFVDLDEALAKYMSLDELTGEINAPRNHDIPVGTYKIKVRAENQKGTVETEFTLVVAENPNYFTYIHYGNNIGLGTTKEEVISYPAQWRLDFDNPAAVTIPVYATDIKEGASVKYSMKAVDAAGFWWDRAGQQKIDASTGEITYNPNTVRREIQVARITAVVGEGETSVTKETLLFIHLSKSQSDGSQPKYKVEYTPFVIRVNPKTGNVLDETTMKVNGAAPMAGFTIDYRGDLRYANLNGPESHVDGRPNDSGTPFMKYLYQKFYDSINVGINTGSKDPVSYFARSTVMASKLLYIDNQDGYRLKVNPNIWRNDDGWADGLFIGQMNQGEAGGKDPSNSFGKPRPYNCAVWFDEEF